MFKITDIKLEPIPDTDMDIFFKKVQKVELLTFLIDVAKPTTNI